MLANYRARKEAAEKHAQRREDGAYTYHPWPRSLREYLKRELRKEYKLRYYVLDHAQFDDELDQNDGLAPAEIIADGERSGDKILKSLLRIDFLSAQRNLDNGTQISRAQDLSWRLSRFYAWNLRRREDDHEALRALAASESELTRHFTDVFRDTFKQLRKLEYPGPMNPQLQIKAALQMERLMGDQQAKIHYLLAEDEAGGDAITLPDDCNGLSFKNLVYMGVELFDLHAPWIDVKDDNADERPPLHLIFIEELEAHMHAQLQQAFMRKLTDLLGPLSDGVFRTQFLITTHSSHVLFERSFRPIRYFRRSAEAGPARRHPFTIFYSTMGRHQTIVTFLSAI
jgi:predicted ATP-dependent endonuclease of OLD family